MSYQTIIAAPGFCLGIVCEAEALSEIRFLEPQREQAPDSALAAEAARQLRAYLQSPDFRFDLPLRPSGTKFQRQVWEAIAAIPRGATRSYGELARALRSAPRAVGQACGANPFPLIVPCHRVLAAGGGLGGFNRQGGGFLIAVKRGLLLHEGVFPRPPAG